jgi:transcriptional regulator with XRE-family HTH domain
MGPRLKNARELKDLSQGDLARKTDISKGAISMAERDLTDLTSSHLKLICTTLGVSADYIIFGESRDAHDEWTKLSGTKEGVGLKQAVLNLWKSENLRPLYLKLGKMTLRQLSLVSSMVEAIENQKE